MRRALSGLLLGALLAGGCSQDEAGSAGELCSALGDGSRFASVFEGFDPTDTERAIEQLRTARVQLGELRDAAPRDLHDEIDVQIDAVDELVEALVEVPAGDATAAASAVRALEDELTGVAEATTELATWQAENC